MSDRRFHIVFAGGGTAGHLFPGLAVAAELAALDRPPKITFVGSGKTLEASLVAKAGFEYLSLPCAPAPRGMRGLLRFLARNVAGYAAGRRFLRREHVDAVVGLGGYASVPVCRAASACGLPLTLLEQNAFPGRATRWLAQRADVICTAFEVAREHLDCDCPVRVTGNPIRAGFRPRKSNRKAPSHGSWQRRLLVLGGSGGAASLNEFVPKALYKLRERLSGWQIVHQTGPHAVDQTKNLYRKLMLQAIVVPFVQNLPAVLRRTDLAVCRAGGTTLAELAATGVPAVLVPYVHSADNHQRRNADVFVAAGAARSIDGRDIDSRLDDALVPVLSDLLVDAQPRQVLSRGMLQLARPQAAWQVAMIVHESASRTVDRKVA